jgi:hypothetical protein
MRILAPVLILVLVAVLVINQKELLCFIVSSTATRGGLDGAPPLCCQEVEVEKEVEVWEGQKRQCFTLPTSSQLSGMLLVFKRFFNFDDFILIVMKATAL